jgi:hypothetical protein
VLSLLQLHASVADGVVKIQRGWGVLYIDNMKSEGSMPCAGGSSAALQACVPAYQPHSRWQPHHWARVRSFQPTTLPWLRAREQIDIEVYKVQQVAMARRV